MSTILECAPGPVLGKRKDTDQQCPSLFPGESKRGPDEARKEEEVEKEDLPGVDISDFFERFYFRRKKEEGLLEESSLGFSKEEELKEEDLFIEEELKEANGGGGEKKVEEDGEEEEGECEICKQKGHCFCHCPWLVLVPDDVFPAELPSKWMVVCRYCHGREFKDGKGECVSCASKTKRVKQRRCCICMEPGHLDETDEACEIFGQEFTRENDPFRWNQ